MRQAFIVLAVAGLFAGCASTAAVTADKKVEVAKVPQCYSGDAGRFFNVGDKTTISGLEVSCVATSDGKSGQWMGAKHHK
ncbi:MAG: hypothetical protein HYZ17_10905 [Betaproteobacteria bacterium]|nr:hypothetical protein [Betaproteobacteria bacterium]